MEGLTIVETRPPEPGCLSVPVIAAGTCSSNVCSFASGLYCRFAPGLRSERFLSVSRRDAVPAASLQPTRSVNPWVAPVCSFLPWLFFYTAEFLLQQNQHLPAPSWTASFSLFCSQFTPLVNALRGEAAEFQLYHRLQTAHNSQLIISHLFKVKIAHVDDSRFSSGSSSFRTPHMHVSR